MIIHTNIKQNFNLIDLIQNFVEFFLWVFKTNNWQHWVTPFFNSLIPSRFQ